MWGYSVRDRSARLHCHACLLRAGAARPLSGSSEESVGAGQEKWPRAAGGMQPQRRGGTEKRRAGCASRRGWLNLPQISIQRFAVFIAFFAGDLRQIQPTITIWSKRSGVGTPLRVLQYAAVARFWRELAGPRNTPRRRNPRSSPLRVSVPPWFIPHSTTRDYPDTKNFERKNVTKYRIRRRSSR